MEPHILNRRQSFSFKLKVMASVNKFRLARVLLLLAALGAKSEFNPAFRGMYAGITSPYLNRGRQFRKSYKCWAVEGAQRRQTFSLKGFHAMAGAASHVR